MRDKALLILIFLLQANLACSRSPKWVNKESYGQGGATLPPSLKKNLSATTLNNKKITIKAQEVAGVLLEDTYAKVVISKNTKMTEKVSKTTFWTKMKYISPEDLPSAKWVKNSLRTKNLAMLAVKTKKLSTYCKNTKAALSQTQPVLQWEKKKWRLAFKGYCESAHNLLYTFLLDSHGEVIDFSPTGASFDENDNALQIQAHLYPKGPRSSKLTTLRLTLSEHPHYLFNPYLLTVSDAEAKITDLTQIPTIQPPDPRFDLLQVYFYANASLTWLSKQFSFTPEHLKIRVHVGHPEKTNTTFYLQREIRLGAGDDIIFSQLCWDPSIVIHEVMHSAIDTTIRLPFRGQGGSLNEALADSLTALFLDDPQMGRNSYQKGPYQRTLETHILFSEQKGSLYADSLILSGTIWEIRQKAGMSYALSLTEFLLTYLVPASDFADTKNQIQKWFDQFESAEQKEPIRKILQGRGWI